MNLNTIGAACAALLTRVNFQIVDAQQVIDDIKRGYLDKELTKWLASRSYIPVCPPLPINRSIPVEKIGPCWPIWLGPKDGDGLTGEPNQDLRALALKEFDPAKAVLLTGLEEVETVVTGEKKLERFAKGKEIPVDDQTLWTLYNENGQKTLEWMNKYLGATWLEASGTVLLHPNGRRFSLCLCRKTDGGWGWLCNWLGGDQSASNPSLGLGK
jgi:hypothetical protein